jgi:hypothetical protein
MPAFDSQRYVFLLPLLGATAEQNDDSLSVFSEIDPVAWTEINAAFKDPAADSLHIREVSQAHPVECGGHSPRRFGVEPVKPLPEEVSSVTAEIFPDVDHLDNGSIYYPNKVEDSINGRVPQIRIFGPGDHEPQPAIF